MIGISTDAGFFIGLISSDKLIAYSS